MSNRIEQIIGDIEEYIDSCKMQAFSNTKIILDRPQLEEYLDELRRYTPEEVKKYQRMINNRDKIMEDAKKRADEVEKKAEEYARRLIDENQITEGAYERANQILNSANERADQILEAANEEARQIREGAFAYTNEMLSNLQQMLAGTIDDFEVRSRDLLGSLNDHLNIVSGNLDELNNVTTEEPEPAEENAQPFFESDRNDDGFFESN